MSLLKHIVLIGALSPVFSYAQGMLDTELSFDENFQFTQPDTITTNEAFRKNDSLGFPTLEEIDEMIITNHLSFRPDTVHRIETDSSIFLDYQFTERGMFYRYAFWFHYTEDNRHAIRQRVYVEFDTTDFNADNDLLVFQAHYVAFQVVDPYKTKKRLPEGRLAQLKWIEEIIDKDYVGYMTQWKYRNYPEFPFVSSYAVEWPKEHGRPYELDVSFPHYHNRNHELYVGTKNSTGTKEFDPSLYILFYPIGDYKALFVNGDIWMSFWQFCKTKGQYTTKPKKLKPEHKRRFYIGKEGTFTLNKYGGHPHFIVNYEKGLKHGFSYNFMGISSDPNYRGVDKREYYYSELLRVIHIDKNGAADLEENYDTPETRKEGDKRYKYFVRKWKMKN